jgi:ribosomal-protein-alanine N-acetyltransferase
MEHRHKYSTSEGVLVLRQCTERDEPAIAVMEKECFGQDSWNSFFIRHCINSYFFPGAFINEKLAGYGTCRIKEHVLHLDNLAVDPLFRRKGIGSLLLGYMLQKGLARGCLKAVLQVEVENTQAIDLYTRTGFLIINRLRSYYQRKKGPNKDAFLMQGSFYNNFGGQTIIIPKDSLRTEEKELSPENE